MNQKSYDRKKKENVLFSLVLNIVIPTFILMKCSGPDMLGPSLGLVSALVFPLSYGCFDFYKRGTVNFISLLGFFSTLATGGIGFLSLSPKYIAVKEALFPFLIACFVLLSVRREQSFVSTLLEQVLDVQSLEKNLKTRQCWDVFQAKLRRSNYMVAVSFLVSAILNYVLASQIVVSPSGTEAFNVELGRLTMLSYPIIALPSTALLAIVMWQLFSALSNWTGLDMESLFSK